MAEERAKSPAVSTGLTPRRPRAQGSVPGAGPGRGRGRGRGRAGPFGPGGALRFEQPRPVVDHSGLILVPSAQGTGFLIRELLESLKACLKRNISFTILRVITYKQHFYF